MSTTYPYKCTHCGITLQRPGMDPPTKCPECGENSWHGVIEFEDAMPSLIGEFEAVARHSSGEIFAERIEKADRITSSSVSVDAGQPSRLLVERAGRVKGFDEEGAAVDSLVKAINNSRGTSYTVEPKADEDSGYVDRSLVSQHDAPGRIDVQVRNLDDQLIAGLGSQRQFAGARTIEDRVAQIDAAIEAKANVDVAQKAKTILLLCLPAPIGQLAKQQLSERAFDKRGFKEIWIAPFHEQCFPLS